MSTDLTFTPEQVLATPAGTLAQQPAELLFSIKNAAADLLAAGKALSDHIDQAIADSLAQRNAIVFAAHPRSKLRGIRGAAA